MKMPFMPKKKNNQPPTTGDEARIKREREYEARLRNAGKRRPERSSYDTRYQ